jgi:hypothetical protein
LQKKVRISLEKKSRKIRENQWDVFVKRAQGNPNRNKKMKINQKQSVPVKICVPIVKNSMLQQSRTVTRLKCGLQQVTPWAIQMVIGAILVVRNLFKKKQENPLS